MQKKKYHKMKSKNVGSAAHNDPKNSGITLIALIITIIVILILVAVTVRTAVNSGLFKHAGDAVNGFSMQEAREKLGTTLSGAMAEKYINKYYDENDYLDDYIRDNLPGSNIAGDIVVVDGWAFELDRSVPEISQNLGIEGDYTFPKILSVTTNISDSKETATLTIEAEETENGIDRIEIYLNGKKVDEKSCGGSKEKVTVTTNPLTENGKYTIKVYSKLMASEKVRVSGIAELTTDRSELKVGDYIAYTPDTVGNYMGLGISESEKAGSRSNPAVGIPQDATLKWRVMNINDDGSVDVVSAVPIATSVYFKGSVGYNNGVLLLNDLCKTQYSNSTLGATARSIDLIDIENKINSTGIAARDAYTSNGNIQYGNPQTSTGDYSYAPDIYDHVGKTIAEESKDYYSTPTTATHTKKETLDVQQTYYYFSDTPAEYFDDATFHELIFGTGTSYWLASRYANCGSAGAGFGLRCASSAGLGGSDLFYSGYYTNYDYGYRVRPVVSLGSNIKISTVGGTEDCPRTLGL